MIILAGLLVLVFVWVWVVFLNSLCRFVVVSNSDDGSLWLKPQAGQKPNLLKQVGEVRLAEK